MPSKHMGLGELTSDLDAYVLPGVPWTSFFFPESGEFEGVAFHGTYWHDNFGTPMSHGCINMRVEEAKWIFRWTSPFNGGDKVDVPGYGTRVFVYQPCLKFGLFSPTNCINTWFPNSRPWRVSRKQSPSMPSSSKRPLCCKAWISRPK